MAAETLLSRLGHVRRCGHSKWVACCPAHDDRSPSLSIEELIDGRLLIHCFGGCAPSAVLDAIGLDFAALFPERDPDDVGRRKGWRSAPGRGARQRTGGVSAGTALTAISADVTEAAVIVSDIAKGDADAESARLQLWKLAGRIAKALALTEARRA